MPDISQKIRLAVKNFSYFGIEKVREGSAARREYCLAGGLAQPVSALPAAASEDR